MAAYGDLPKGRLDSHPDNSVHVMAYAAQSSGELDIPHWNQLLRASGMRGQAGEDAEEQSHPASIPPAEPLTGTWCLWSCHNRP